MIIIMRKACTPEELAGVQRRIESHGLKPHLSEGVERTVVGVLGQTFRELKDELEVLPGVVEVVPISKPYKLSSREFKNEDTVVRVGNVTIGGDELVVMAGPCAVENEEQVLSTAHAVKRAGAQILRGGAFKPRSSPYSFRGMGVQGLQILAKARSETGMPIVTEVMAPEDVGMVAQYADILQIGTRNAQNFNLLDEVGKIRKPVLLKRGFASSYEEWLLSAEYILSGGNSQVVLCERGIRTFETATRFTIDLAAIPMIKDLSHLPVMADPSHATGRANLVTPMSLAAVAAGTHGIIVDVHPNPSVAKCDAAQALTFDKFDEMMVQVLAVARAVGKVPTGAGA
jgi:3-deoxy-7-phosphoheptulonate synthase